MICITGNEADTGSLAARLAQRPEAMHEVRLDALARIDDDVFSLLETHRSRLLVCCRAPREGGAFGGSEPERLAQLRRAHDLGVRWVDVEADADRTGFEPERLVLSHHRFEPGGDPERELRRMRPHAAVVKLAATVEDAADLAPLRAARRAVDGEAVVIGMGEAGRLSRARYRAFGSSWTYVAADAAHATAPGQLDAAEAEHQGITEDAPFCALVGGSQVLRSPGPVVYPPLFARRAEIPARSYLPVVTHRLDETLPLLEALGCAGLSVTMPLKQRAAELSAPDALVRRLGAANTMRRQDGGWASTNTDVEGVRRPLEGRVKRGSRALVLGAGGAARAAVEACRRLELDVRVSARRPEAAKALGPPVVPWERRGTESHAILINATPLTGERSPWPEARVRARIVFDLALGGERPTRLERQATEACFLDPLAMWRAQGAAQIGYFFDTSIAAEELSA